MSSSKMKCDRCKTEGNVEDVGVYKLCKACREELKLWVEQPLFQKKTYPKLPDDDDFIKDFVYV